MTLQVYRLIFIFALLLCLGASMMFGGSPGLAGMALGLGTGALGAYSLVWVTKLLGSVATETGTAKFGTLAAIFTFIAKAAAFFLIFLLAGRLGGAASGCFVVGVVVVYSLTVVWGISR